jgi:hypothetical protein
LPMSVHWKVIFLGEGVVNMDGKLALLSQWL